LQGYITFILVVYISFGQLNETNYIKVKDIVDREYIFKELGDMKALFACFNSRWKNCLKVGRFRVVSNFASETNEFFSTSKFIMDKIAGQVVK